MSAQRHISIPNPFSTGNALEWFQRFELCCKANNWDGDMQAVKLPTLLEGEALAIWLDLTENEQKDYERAKKAIIDGIMPMAFTSLEEFHHRKLHPGESLSVYVHNLKVLIERAMPGIDATSRGQLLLHQFLAGIPLQVSRQLRAMGDTTDLQRVVEKARLLMTIEEQPENAATPINAVQEGTLAKLQSQIETLTQQVATLATQPPRQPVVKRCFSCNQVGHIQRQCPHRQQPLYLLRCFSCGQLGHLARQCYQLNTNGASVQGSRRPRNQ